MYQLFKKSMLIWLFITSLLFSYDVRSSENWLVNQVNSDTFIENHSNIALFIQSARESVSALQKRSKLSGIDESKVLEYFDSIEDNSTEFLVSQIIVRHAFSKDTHSIENVLKTLQNNDGGFGHSASYESTALDTSLSLEILADAKSIAYLKATQLASGKWQDVEGKNLYTTALALRALWLHRKSYDVQNAVDLAKDYLLSHKEADGSYGEMYITALVLRSIAPLMYDISKIDDTIAYLKDAQLASGSWQNDVYTTALVLQALSIADKAVPNPDLAKLSGVVVDGDSGIALSGIVIQLNGGSNITTASDGHFAFGGLQNNTYTIDVLSDNYAPLHTSVRMVGDAVDLGMLRLNKNVNSTISTLKGTVKDQETGEALSGAAIKIGAYEATTANDGSYTVDTIEAGNYTVTVEKSGYLQKIRNINVPANTILNYDILLRDFSFEVSVNIGATIVDNNTSLPLENVNISLFGEGLTKSFATQNDGVFEFSNIPQGTYSLQIDKTSYYQVQTTFTVSSSQNINFGIVRLVPIDSNIPAFATVQGKITDRFSKEVIGNALIDISGLTVFTHTDGTYSIDTVPVGDINLTVSKDGYQSAIGNASVTAGSTLIFSPSLQEVDGNLKLYGTILDSNSSEPLSDVNVSILNEVNTTVFTDMNGTYLIDNIPVGDITIKVEKFGYRTVTITTNVSDKSIEFSPTLQRNATINNQTTISGNVVDVASKELLVNVAFYVNGVDTGIRSDSDGNFTIENITATDINLTLKYTDYKDVNSIIFLDVAQDINIGTLHMRSIAIEDYRPDLVVEAISTSGIASDISTLSVNGELNITVTNRGTISSDAFEIVVFYDSDADGNYTQGVDRNFASHRVEGLDIDGSKVISLDINTTADFRDQAIYVYVDAKNENVELDENNTYSTAKSCGGKQGQVDLGICFDYSGSVGSLANLQKNGLIQALRDPAKFPRDGSIRLTIMTVQRTQLEPTIITNDNAENIADNMSNTHFYGSSAVDDCLRVMANKLNSLPNQSAYKAVTLSGDGYWGGGVASDRDYAVSKGINVIDAIAVGNSLGWSTLNTIVYPQPVGGELGVVYRATTAEEVSNSLVRTFQKQTQIADLTLGKLKIIDNGTEQNISIKFTVGNAGVATIPSDISISVYEGDPQDGGVLLASTVLDENLSFGNSIVIEMADIALQEGGEIYVIGDMDNRLVECTKENNSISSIVSPTSTLGNIDTHTDKTSYTANETVSLSANITNPGRLSYDLTAQLILQDNNGNLIQAFDKKSLGIVASNESKTVSNEWNTTDTLEGEYVLRGVLTDTQGNVVDEATTVFNIVHSGVSATLDLMLDRSVYHTSDSVS
ncbi:MAG TPA: DUF1194 domain-containing protein, partial [Sulfurovum sp.]|nr:DUF1194 domain-containing protein [Sulfurovum sp.]